MLIGVGGKHPKQREAQMHKTSHGGHSQSDRETARQLQGWGADTTGACRPFWELRFLSYKARS